MTQISQIKMIKPFALSCVVLLASCTWSDPVRVQDDFGNSVRHMVDQQTKRNNEPLSNDVQKPGALDGDSAINSLGQYRTAQKRTVIKKSLDTFELNQ